MSQMKRTLYVKFHCKFVINQLCNYLLVVKSQTLSWIYTVPVCTRVSMCVFLKGKRRSDVIQFCLFLRISRVGSKQTFGSFERPIMKLRIYLDFYTFPSTGSAQCASFIDTPANKCVENYLLVKSIYSRWFSFKHWQFHVIAHFGLKSASTCLLLVVGRGPQHCVLNFSQEHTVDHISMMHNACFCVKSNSQWHIVRQCATLMMHTCASLITRMCEHNVDSLLYWGWLQLARKHTVRHNS